MCTKLMKMYSVVIALCGASVWQLYSAAAGCNAIMIVPPKVLRQYNSPKCNTIELKQEMILNESGIPEGSEASSLFKEIFYAKKCHPASLDECNQGAQILYDCLEKNDAEKRDQGTEDGRVLRCMYYGLIPALECIVRYYNDIGQAGEAELLRQRNYFWQEYAKAAGLEKDKIERARATENALRMAEEILPNVCTIGYSEAVKHLEGLADYNAMHAWAAWLQINCFRQKYAIACDCAKDTETRKQATEKALQLSRVMQMDNCASDYQDAVGYLHVLEKELGLNQESPVDKN